MRLIDADKLIEKAYWHGNTPSFEELYPEGHDAVDVEEIENSPTVDAMPVVHGYWMKYEVDVAEHPWHCSHCGYCPPKFVSHIEDMKYCNHCGAKMDGEQKDGVNNES